MPACASQSQHPVQVDREPITTHVRRERDAPNSDPGSVVVPLCRRFIGDKKPYVEHTAAYQLRRCSFHVDRETTGWVLWVSKIKANETHLKLEPCFSFPLLTGVYRQRHVKSVQSLTSYGLSDIMSIYVVVCVQNILYVIFNLKDTVKKMLFWD